LGMFLSFYLWVSHLMWTRTLATAKIGPVSSS
jgi:hypothetical protein